MEKFLSYFIRIPQAPSLSSLSALNKRTVSGVKPAMTSTPSGKNWLSATTRRVLTIAATTSADMISEIMTPRAISDIKGEVDASGLEVKNGDLPHVSCGAPLTRA